MASTPERILSWIDAFVFTFAGIIKVTNLLPAAHEEMIEKFSRYALVCPSVYLGYTPNPYVYCFIVGIVELICVLGIILGSADIKHFVYGVLMVIMTGALYTHAMVKEFDGLLVPFLLFIVNLFLFTRHIIRTNQQINTGTTRSNQQKFKRQ